MIFINKPIIQIVPQLPPAINGVGDYAVNLACQLRKDWGIETKFIVGNPTWEGASTIEGFAVQKVFDYSSKTLSILLLNQSSLQIPVLLHYVGYGYAKRGCPVWLIEGLKSWKANNDNFHFVTMFHEIYASSKKPWESSFWLSPLQKNLAVQIAKLSDRCLTSKQLYAEILYNLSGGKHTQIPTLPVFSNIGEPEQIPPLANRHRRMIVFGSARNRRRVYQESLTELIYACKLLEIEEIWDIGSSTGLKLSIINGLPVVEMGKQPAPEISNIMLNSLAGFFNYHPDFLGKSTIFAAYCAHGLLPVSAKGSKLPVDGIESGKHYWIPDSLNNLDEVQAIAQNAHQWYQPHSLSLQAKTFAINLTDTTRKIN
jgi:hypothetical protein